MTTHKEALTLALEALKEIHVGNMTPMAEINWNKAITAIKEALAQPERHELQADGKHPAPCARFCEANAFQIEIRRLKTQLAQPKQEPNFGGVLFAVEEAIRNGDCPWQIESAFDEYEAERKAAHGIKGDA